MTLDAQEVNRITRDLIPVVVWLFFVGSSLAAAYSLRLWLRTRADVAEQRRRGINGVLRYNALGNLRRVRLRIYMCLDCAAIGLAVLIQQQLSPGSAPRALLGLTIYLFMFPLLIGVLFHQSRSDEKHDLGLRRLLEAQRRLEKPGTNVQRT